MKKFLTHPASIIVTFLLICLFLFLFLQKIGKESLKEKPQPIEEATIETPVAEEEVYIYKPFPDTALISSSIFKLLVFEYTNDGKSSWYAAHCFVYAHVGDFSFLALPRHCFKYDTSKRQDLWIENSKGDRTQIRWYKSSSSTLYDAEMLKIDRVEGLALSNTDLISDQVDLADTAIVLSPFNVRKVPRKFGYFLQDNKIEMNTLYGEKGDSGSLIVGRTGVVGVMFATTGLGEKVLYVPILLFEELYKKLVMQKK